MFEQTTDQFAAAGADTVIIPIGTIEAHGRHCPLGTDVLIPRRLAEMVAEMLPGEIILAPEVNYGHSWTLSVYPGTIDIPTDVFSNYVYAICQGFAKWGIKNIVLLNGHGGNNAGLATAAERAADLGVRVATVHWWTDYAKDIVAITGGQGHAGEDETAAVLAIRPDLVDMAKARDNPRRPIGDIKAKDFARESFRDALTGYATRATAEQGEKILAVVAERIAGLIRGLRSGEWLR